ncbi:cell wall protein AWA1-like [Salvia hispanica]|uniref:cell wall protein AWA1-like n=1 Tax=Salvia hispanica TaxID=49212 RepID=UPI002009BE58|nr:cell wall protein AWA1-like [Salvia hispanica]
MSTESNTAAATTSATTAAIISSTMENTGPVKTSSIPSMMPTPGLYPSSSTTPWVDVNTHGLTSGSTSSGSVGSTFSGSFESFNGSSAGPSGLTRVLSSGSHTSAGASGTNMGIGSFRTNMNMSGSMPNMSMAGSTPNKNGGGSMPNMLLALSGATRLVPSMDQVRHH